MSLFTTRKALHAVKLRNDFGIFSLARLNAYRDEVKRIVSLKSMENFPDFMYENGNYVLFNKNHVLIQRLEKSLVLKWKDYDQLNLQPLIKKAAVFLDFNNNHARFVLDITSVASDFEHLATKENEKFINFRTALLALSKSDAAVASKSLALLKWNEELKFCSACGQTLLPFSAGTRRICSSCEKAFYPPLNPVGITLVTNSNDSKVLLVRQPSHPAGMYTCIAGFIEPGESIEDNVKREVAEEVGLEVIGIKYFGSQHWAYPTSSLMIGCVATTDQENISVDSNELEDARWFSVGEVEAALQAVLKRKQQLLTEPGGFWVPPQGAIAHDLIKHWLKQKNN